MIRKTIAGYAGLFGIVIGVALVATGANGYEMIAGYLTIVLGIGGAVYGSTD